LGGNLCDECLSDCYVQNTDECPPSTVNLDLPYCVTAQQLAGGGIEPELNVVHDTFAELSSTSAAPYIGAEHLPRTVQ